MATKVKETKVQVRAGLTAELAIKCERIANDDSKFHEVFEFNTPVHQGDLTIVRIPRLPKSARTRISRQLAIGDTQGSRHIMTRGEIFDANASEVASIISECPELRKVIRESTGRDEIAPQYIGPVFISPENPTADDLTHPEHGNHGFPAGSICATVYHRNLDAEEQEARVAD